MPEENEIDTKLPIDDIIERVIRRLGPIYKEDVEPTPEIGEEPIPEDGEPLPEIEPMTISETTFDKHKTIREIVEDVRDEAFYVGNRMFETPTQLDEFKSIIVHASVIAYENRGVESQTRQGELGQENHFIDWHTYIQEQVVKHGKRYVI